MSERQQRYRVIEKLAAGGMAEVFRAESAGIEGFKKKVAIKRVLPHLSEKKKFISMFLDEARLSAYLTHSNVVQVFDIGIGDSTYFIVMEYVDGADLKAIIDALRKSGGEFPIEAAVYIGTKICEGLAYAHELGDHDGKPFGVVHRDLSPPNVLISRFGEVKIADFGLAKASTQLEKSEPGVIKGKFSYLSPEAAFGYEVDARADIFAVGIILWELLAGRRLFMGESDYGTVKLVQQAQVPPLSSINHKVPPGLERVIHRALARDLADRYGKARDLARDLNAFLFHHGHPVGPWDIAELVSQTVRQKQRERPGQVSIIDQLIKEALFEFTSLRSGEQDSLVSSAGGRSTPTTSPVPALEGGRVRDWGSEIVIKNPYGSERPASPNDKLLSSLQSLQAGNLSQLEDMPSSPQTRPRPSSDKPATSLERTPKPPTAGELYPSTENKPWMNPGGLRSSSPPPALAPSGTGKVVAEGSSRKTLLIVLILLAIVIAMGAFAAVYFTRLQPH